MSARVQEIRERVAHCTPDQLAPTCRCDLVVLLAEIDRLRHAADVAIEAAQAHERGHTSTAERLGRIAERALHPEQLVADVNARRRRSEVAR